jgi:hypothetical protein
MPGLAENDGGKNGRRNTLRYSALRRLYYQRKRQAGTVRKALRAGRVDRFFTCINR